MESLARSRYEMKFIQIYWSSRNFKYDECCITCFLKLLQTAKTVMKNSVLFILLQFFAHPVINNLMTEKWHGELGRKKRSSWLTMDRWTWCFLNVWCLFDLVLFPLLFIVFGFYHFARKKIRNRKGN